MLPFFGGEIVGELAVPTFHHVFQDGKLIDNELNNQLKAVLHQLID